ncbi:MAG: hypothetical protein ABW061_01475 [Polyangiaceae bacterium]
MARITSNRAPRWAARLAICVYAAGSVGCSSDSQHDGESPGSEEPTPRGDAGSDGEAGSGDSGGGKSGVGGSGTATGQAGDGEGGSEGGDLATGTWDASSWDEALWE